MGSERGNSFSRGTKSRARLETLLPGQMRHLEKEGVKKTEIQRFDRRICRFSRYTGFWNRGSYNYCRPGL